MKYRPDDELLASYLSGETSQEDEARVEEWIQSDSENKRLVDEMRELWKRQQPESPTWDTEKLWNKVSAGAGINQRQDNAVKKLSTDTKRHFSIFARIAAAVVLTASLAYFYTQFIATESSDAPLAHNLKSVLVEYGKRASLTLHDGTRVTLDAGTQFRYPVQFSEDKREVFLEGEGYFEVHSDDRKPFIVHANGGVVKVLGTKFNIRAWEKDRNIKVAVVEGRVSLSRENSQSGDEVMISKNQMGSIDENGITSQAMDTDANRYLGWINLEAEFENTPLIEVLNQLERWYDVDISLTDAALASEQINVSIQNRPLENTLGLIGDMVGQEHTTNGKKITFRAKKD